ncbi:hypothetical protein EBT31_18840 [bacterium]|jgi:hypothetical protein|nr:hypothetical protein [bacterium]
MIGLQSTRLIGTTEARELRNQPEYDDWYAGLEPIPGDTHWVRIKTLTQLYRHLIYVFATSDTISSTRLAKLAIHEILKLRLTDLTRLRQQDPNFFA